MRKYISPIVAFYMGIFMLLSACTYMMVILSCIDPIQLDWQTRLFLSIPTLFLVISGIATMLWSIVMHDKLRFSQEADGWVLK